MIDHDTRDGYRLLWNVLHLTLTAFKPTCRIEFPLWHDENQDVYQFAKACLLYFRLQRKRREKFPPKEKSLMFLRGIRGSILVPIVSSFITMVTEIRPPNAAVPFTLEIPQLATRIENDMASTHSDFDQRRRANVLDGNEFLDGDEMFPLIQGA